ncbi:MAG: TIGR02099 family protein, partial [Pseudomonadota bacterium]|nr:TIGR02099 family protein [Pseudomonadota bacterium]
MKTFLKGCAATISLVVVIMLIAVAVLRLAAPLLAQQRQTIEKLVSAAIDRPVYIGMVAVEWEGLSPHLTLHEVKVLDAEHKPILAFEEAYLTPDLVGTLLNWRFRLESLHVIGADIHVVRESNGRIKLQGLEFSPYAKLKGLHHVSLTLRSSTVQWEDRQLKVNYEFKDVDLTVIFRGQRRRLAASIIPRPDLGRRVILFADLRGARPAAWRGKVYLRAAAVQVDALPQSLHAGLARGEITGEVWSTWRRGKPVSVLGHMDAEQISLAEESTADTPDLAGLRARFLWQRQGAGWALEAANLTLSRAGHSWCSDAASLSYHPRPRGRVILSGALSYARIQDLVALVIRTGQIDDRLAGKLGARSLTGELAGLRFAVELEAGDFKRYSVAGEFRDLALTVTNQTFGFDGADGRFHADQTGGRLNLQTQVLTVNYPRLFANAFGIDYLRGPLRWRREEGLTTIQSSALAFGNQDIKAHGRVLLRLGEGSPHLNMRLALSDGNVAHTARYLPVKILRPRARDWLEHALVDGRLIRGDMIFKGDVSDFPFRANQGVFEARLDIAKGILDYKPGWPRAEAIDAELVFHNQSLSATSSHARVLGSSIDAAKLNIADLRQAELRLNLQAHGPVTAAVGYLQRASLVGPRTFDKLAIEGAGRLSLSIKVPLSEELKEKNHTRVSGEAQFKNVGLRIIPANIAFTAITGNLRFGPENVFHATAMSAQLRGHAMRIDVAPVANAGTEVTMHGRLPAAALVRGFKHPLLSRIQGESTWVAKVGLPALKQPGETREPKPISLSLVSSLEGTAVNLPQPLGKAADARRSLMLATAIGYGVPRWIRLQYGREISAVAALGMGANGLRLARGELRINQGLAMLPDAGLFIRARMAEFSWSAWQPWLVGGTILGAGGQAPGSGLLREIDASLGRLKWSGHTFDNVRLLGRRGALRWLIKVNSPQIAGHIAAPIDRDSAIPLLVNLDHLVLTTGLHRPRPSTLDPRRLPPLRLVIRQLRINALEFTNLSLITARMPDGLRLQALELSAPDLQGQAQGTWRVVSTGQQQSSVDLVLESSDLGAVLDRWGLTHSVRGGDAHLEAHLAWAGGPFHPNLKSLIGNAHERVKHGRLRGIDPGPSRLLGLLNVNAIARRLALDFSDLFKSGFSFDVIKGDFSFTDANMYTDNLIIKGPSASIGITGRTGLLARDYDQR